MEYLMDVSKEQLEDLINHLEINVENILHVILTNGTEMVGEVLSPDNIQLDDAYSTIIDPDSAQTILFLNPIKIYRDLWVDDESNMQHKDYFMDFNPCIDGPFIPIYKNSITTKNPPNGETLIRYLKALYQLYYPLLSETPLGNITAFSEPHNIPAKLKGKSVHKNIIQFTPYLKKRQLGNF